MQRTTSHGPRAGKKRVAVAAFKAERQRIALGHPTAGADLKKALEDLGHPRGLPLSKVGLEFVLEGASTALANSVRRALAGELEGRCLTFDPEDYQTTDPFMGDYDFVRDRVRMIRLRPQVSEALLAELTFSLDVENPSAEVRMVHSGDLVPSQAYETPLFNPTVELAFLQPGTSLKIRGIRFAAGWGSGDAAFAVAARAAAVPLDLAEVPRGETHGKDSAARDLSGYRDSCLVANPRRHALRATLFAVPEAVDETKAAALLLQRVSQSLWRRAERITRVLDAPLAEDRDGGLTRRVAGDFFRAEPRPDGGTVQGTLRLQKETYTIGRALTREVYDAFPDLPHVSGNCVPHNEYLEVSVVVKGQDGEEAAAVLKEGADRLAAAYREIGDYFEKA
jgi:DNA-directed RNA polymerase subunit L